jgi:hypothetical protein
MLKAQVKMTMEPRVIWITDAGSIRYAMFTSVVAVQSQHVGTKKIQFGGAGAEIVCDATLNLSTPLRTVAKKTKRHKSSPIIMNKVWRKGWSKPVPAFPGPVGTVCMVMNFIKRVLQVPVMSIITI